MDFDYKKYSLEKLEEWVHDAMSSDASPHEIYSTIREVVQENYNYHREQVSRAYGLLELLSGHRPVADIELLETVLAEREYYEGKNKPLSCDKDDPSPECQKSWNDFWEDQSPPLHVSEDGDLFVKDNVEKKDKVKKWVLPVDIDCLTGDCVVNFPEDLLEAANLKEGDKVEWEEQDNGSYLLRKV